MKKLFCKTNLKLKVLKLIKTKSLLLCCSLDNYIFVYSIFSTHSIILLYQHLNYSMCLINIFPYVFSNLFGHHTLYFLIFAINYLQIIRWNYKCRSLRSSLEKGMLHRPPLQFLDLQVSKVCIQTFKGVLLEESNTIVCSCLSLKVYNQSIYKYFFNIVFYYFMQWN